MRCMPLMRRIRAMVPWTALALSVLAILGPLWWHLGDQPKGSGESNSGRRWKSVDDIVESDNFKHLTGLTARDLTARDLLLPPRHRIVSSYRTDWTRPRVAAYAAPMPQPRATLRDLSDDGQSHAIDLLTQNSVSSPHSWDDLRKALVDENSSGPLDPFHFDRILVATVTKGVDSDSGDRMMWTRVFVQPINFRFAGYTVAATENETANIANIESTKSRKLSAQLGLSVPGLRGLSASISPSDEHTINTKSEITAQYERLGVDIMPEFLRNHPRKRNQWRCGRQYHGCAVHRDGSIDDPQKIPRG